MFKKKKVFTLISILSLASLFSIGLGSFIIINEVNLELNMTPNYGVVEENISGISINNEKSLKMGKYFYYEDNTSVKKGSLSYLINIEPSLLTDELKVSNENNGYSFTLLSSLEINNLEIFNDNSYLVSASFNNNPLTLNYNKNIVNFNIEISTTSIDILETFNLSFKFSNKLIIDHKADLINKSFILKVNV